MSWNSTKLIGSAQCELKEIKQDHLYGSNEFANIYTMPNAYKLCAKHAQRTFNSNHRKNTTEIKTRNRTEIN